MIVNPGFHLAELNVGRLMAPTDDPRVAELVAALDRINGLGKRMPGFVWMMEGSGEPGRGNTKAKMDADPQGVSNLTFWDSVETVGLGCTPVKQAHWLTHRSAQGAAA